VQTEDGLALAATEGGEFTVTYKVDGEDVPQVFPAVTLIVPLLPAVAVIEFVVEEPDQPAGSDHE
jgi:hypothetical protein